MAAVTGIHACPKMIPQKIGFVETKKGINETPTLTIGECGGRTTLLQVFQPYRIAIENIAGHDYCCSPFRSG